MGFSCAARSVVVIEISCNDSMCTAAGSGALVEHSAKAFFTVAFCCH